MKLFKVLVFVNRTPDIRELINIEYYQSNDEKIVEDYVSDTYGKDEDYSYLVIEIEPKDIVFSYSEE